MTSRISVRKIVGWLAAAALVSLVALCGRGVVWPELPDQARPVIRFAFFNIGQGDAALVADGGGNQVLIDGGPDSAILEKLGRYLPTGDRTIELVILTHPHSDHMSGLFAVWEKYHVNRLLVGKDAAKDSIASTLVTKAKALGTIVREAEIGTQKIGEIKIETLNAGDEKTDDWNDKSLVIDSGCGAARALFMADASEKIEEKLLSANLVGAAALIKIGHHGSGRSSSREFLKKVSPQFAVVSAGKNSYGQPSSKTLFRLKEQDARIWRTDQDGDVLAVTDCEEFAVSGSRPKPGRPLLLRRLLDKIGAKIKYDKRH